jgi:hypothetical protein
LPLGHAVEVAPALDGGEELAQLLALAFVHVAGVVLRGQS